MALLSWSDQYLIGEESIDAEHRELFVLVNTFHDRWIERRDREDIAAVLTQLVAYAERHFQNEERLMQAADYTELAEHRGVHETMVDTLFRLRQSFEENNMHLELDTMKFVRGWLLEHILAQDYRFRDFLAHRKSCADVTGASTEAPAASDATTTH